MAISSNSSSTQIVKSNNKMSKKQHHSSSSSSSNPPPPTNTFPSCFRRLTKVASAAAAPPPPPSSAAQPNLVTSLYHTHIGIFALTWSQSLFGRSFHIHFMLNDSSSSSSSSSGDVSFHFHIKPFMFWKKQGSKKLKIDGNEDANVQIYWDLSGAKFGFGPEPRSGFYISVVFNGEMVLLVGDSDKEAYTRTRARNPEKDPINILRREHVYGNKLYTTKALIGGKEREISINCRLGDDPRLVFSVDNKRVLQIKHLKWKFRGNERIEIDSVPVIVSWDVYNWLFEDEEDGYALFMFKFENSSLEVEKNGVSIWSQQSCGFGFETKMMKKGLLRNSRSSLSSRSSSSLSSVSSSSSSVMEWASTEENELKGPSGFSLLVYAWKS